MSFKTAIEGINAEEEGLLVLNQPDIDRIHESLLKMLADFDAFCKEKKIAWSLAGGSILGAVRHHGFIPWDDDADIHMTRLAFEKLKCELKKTPMQEYSLKCPGDKDYIYHYPKLYKKGTIFREIQSNDKNPNGLFIDIFILEDIPDSKIKRFLHGLQCSFYLLAISALRVDACKKTLLTYTRHNSIAQKEIKKRCHLSRFFKFRRLSSWTRKADQCFSKYTSDDSELIGIPTGAQHYFGELYKRNQMCCQKRVAFEHLVLPVPVEAEAILCQRYGNNYMALPPKNKRAKHAIIEFKL